MLALSSAYVAQPISAGVLAAAVGFASSAAIVLAGFIAAGATPREAASGLFAISIGQAFLGIVLGVRSRIPITIAWSTPGAALLISSGAPTGGYAYATGAFLVVGALIVAAG